jgi:hypothetical protein
MNTTTVSERNRQLQPGDIIFPRCGLTYSDLVGVAENCRTKKGAATKLGVSENQLDRVIRRYDLTHLFSKQAGELFAGITATDLLRAASRFANMGQAALALGVSPGYFTKKVKELGATEHFKRKRNRRRRVCRRSIIKLAREGYTRRDAAYLLGISDSYLKDLIHQWSLADEFIVSKGRAAWVTRRGYCN